MSSKFENTAIALDRDQIIDIPHEQEEYLSVVSQHLYDGDKSGNTQRLHFPFMIHFTMSQFKVFLLPFALVGPEIHNSIKALILVLRHFQSFFFLHYFKISLRKYGGQLVNRTEDFSRQSPILRNLLSSNVFCSWYGFPGRYRSSSLFLISPPAPGPAQQLELIWRCLRTFYLLNYSHLFSIILIIHIDCVDYYIFQKKKKKKLSKKIVTLDPRHGILDP